MYFHYQYLTTLLCAVHFVCLFHLQLHYHALQLLPPGACKLKNLASKLAEMYVMLENKEG